MRLVEVVGCRIANYFSECIPAHIWNVVIRVSAIIS